MNKKVITTFAFGDTFEKMLDVSIESFKKLAFNCNYDFILGSDLDINSDRPYSWWKIKIFEKLFETYENILWLDCDAIVLKSNIDPLEDFNNKYLQAIVEIDIFENGKIPNAGVWGLNKEIKELGILDSIWNKNKYINHPWWENTALLEVMGYLIPESHTSEIKLKNKTELYNRTMWLDQSFNIHPHDIREIPQKQNIYHATNCLNRLEVMKKWANTTY